jgi:hypothetical protein
LDGKARPHHKTGGNDSGSGNKSVTKHDHVRCDFLS